MMANPLPAPRSTTRNPGPNEAHHHTATSTVGRMIAEAEGT